MQVICQLRFPSILRIDTHIPSEFQELVRSQFPLYTEKLEGNVDIPKSIAETIPPEILSSFSPGPVKRNHEFVDESRHWKINLTNHFVALSTTNYENWESFSRLLEEAIHALTEVYSPAYYSRIGLRYTDVINRKKLDLTGSGWGDLLNVHILGLTGSEIVAGKVLDHNCEHIVALDNGSSSVKIRTKFVTQGESEEQCFMIDSDFSESNNTPIEKANTLLQYFNIRSSRFIQWCISEKLKIAMGGKLLK